MSVSSDMQERIGSQINIERLPEAGYISSLGRSQFKQREIEGSQHIHHVLIELAIELRKYLFMAIVAKIASSADEARTLSCE